MKRASGVLAALLALLGTGCLDGMGPSHHPAQPVIIVLLSAGDQTHAVTATWSIPAESSAVLQGRQRPIAAQDLVIAVRAPDGSLTVPEQISQTPGLYSLRLTVVPGEEYRLVGSVAGRPFSGSSRVPLEATFVEPAGGVFRLKVGQPGLPYLIRSPGTALVLFSDVGGMFNLQLGDTVGVFPQSPRFMTPPTPGQYEVVVETWDRAAAGYFFREDWVTNLTGAVGVFGSRTHRLFPVIVDP